MSSDQLAIVSITSREQDQESEDELVIRDIHALSPPRPPSSANHHQARSTWDTSSHTHRLSSLSMTSEGASSENFTSMSREFNALVIAGSTIGNNGSENGDPTRSSNNLVRIGENETPDQETNPLAIVPDVNPLGPVTSPRHAGGVVLANGNQRELSSMVRVKKEEVESKINAWQTAKVAKVNNRFKREDAIISGWETEQVQKANSWMKKVERKLEEKRAKALEKMENDIAKAHRKAEERRASAEANRGTKAAKVLEIANLMRAVGRAPVKRSFF